MNSIEMTDFDGDALTLITREGRTWITCTSGRDEVTVGPFPSRVVKQMLAAESLEDRATTLVTSADAERPEHALDRRAHDRAWSEFTRLARSRSLRASLEGALEAAVAVPEERGDDAVELAAELRGIAVPLEDPDALADHLVSLGYRRD